MDFISLVGQAGHFVVLGTMGLGNESHASEDYVDVDYEYWV